MHNIFHLFSNFIAAHVYRVHASYLLSLWNVITFFQISSDSFSSSSFFMSYWYTNYYNLGIGYMFLNLVSLHLFTEMVHKDFSSSIRIYMQLRLYQ